MSGCSLIENFKADDVRLFLTSSNEDNEGLDKAFSRRAKDNHYTLSSKDPLFDMFSKNFADGETYCGELNDEQRALLCTGCETELASAALIPLQFNGAMGALVMGSSDAMFLNQLGEVLSRRVQTFLLAEKAAQEASAKITKTAKSNTEELANV